MGGLITSSYELLSQHLTPWTMFNAGNPLRAPFAASYTMDDTLDATLDSVSAEHPVRTFFDQSMPAQACFATSDIMSSTQAPPIQSCFNAMPEDFTNSVV